MPSRRLQAGLTAFVATGLLAVIAACSAAPAASQTCTPKKRYHCICRDKNEGEKVCNDEGTGYERCDPCQSFDNPEEPGNGDVDPIPITEEDGGGGGETPRSCGNGKVEEGEDCDDSTSASTDGCDKCKLAGPTPTKSVGCPGLDVHVWGGAHKPSVVIDTTGSGNHTVTPSCTGGANPTTGSAAPDRVFKVTAHKSGTLKVSTSDAAYDVFLYIAGSCPTEGNVAYLTCANKTAGKVAEVASTSVEAGKAYYVFVDGYGVTSSTNQGSVRVTFEIP